MDVAKYIGLFLLKNKFVYVHGLGNLEIKKKPSKYDGEALTAPVYEVIMTPMGSIDDNLANFIATNEQISISKASNALREFSMQARATMHGGQAIEIPGIGKFSEERGKTVFTTDPNFTHIPPSLPTIKYARREEEKTEEIPSTSAAAETLSNTNTQQYEMPAYRMDEQERTVSWGKIVAWIGALAAVAALVFLGIRYMDKHDATTDVPLITSPDTVKNTPANIESVDTSSKSIDNSSDAVAVNESGLLNFEVILNTYDAVDKAQRRANKLKSYGNNVEMRPAADSSVFYVIMPLSDIAAADTTRVLDSLRRNFNPNGVSIMR